MIDARRPLRCALLAMAGVSFSAAAFAAITEAEYRAAKQRADAAYKAARERCGTLSGNDRDLCVLQARAERIRARAQAEAAYQETARARAAAEKRIER